MKRDPAGTRLRLLTASIRLFSARGYHAVAVDEIVKLAKSNKRMVYHYFGSKEEIYRAALSAVYGRIESVELKAIERGRTPHEKLTRLLESYFDFLVKNPEFTKLLAWENLEQGRHLSGSGLGRLNKNPFFVRFREVIEQGVRSGDFRKTLDVTHLLINLIGLCFIYHSNRYSLSQGLNLDLGNPAVRSQGLDQVLTLVFEGISARPALRGNRANGV